MEQQTRFEKLQSFARKHYENGDPAHDFAHILRVVETATRLGQRENVNLDILRPAALLHDWVNLPKNHPERAKASEWTAQAVRPLLEDCGYSQTEIDSICTVVLEHSFSLGRAPSLRESAVLQDADRLDALGAIGLLRMVTVGAKLGRTFYDVQDPFWEKRAPDDQNFTIDHFETKLFKLAGKMNTEAAREEAEARTRYMRAFLDKLRREISTPD